MRFAGAQARLPALSGSDRQWTGHFTQEDPIGLAGGLNLYGYANGDPVNFSDPFGLSADTVKALDKKTAADLEALRKSPSFNAAYEKLDADPNTLVLVYRAQNNCGGSGAGCAIGPIDMGGGKTAFAIPIDDQGVSASNRMQQLLWGDIATSQTVVAHEFFGHVVPAARGGYCADPAPGATSGCSINRENVIRAQLGLPRRTHY